MEKEKINKLTSKFPITVDEMSLLDLLIDLVDTGGSISEISFNYFLSKIGLSALTLKEQIEFINLLIYLLIRMPLTIFSGKDAQRQRALDSIRTISRQKLRNLSEQQTTVRPSFLKPKSKIIEYC